MTASEQGREIEFRLGAKLSFACDDTSNNWR